MTSDLEQPADSDEEPKKSSERILRHELVEATDALHRSATRLFVSGFSAGLDLGFSLLMIAVVRTAAGDSLHQPGIQILLATMYSFGFIVVVLGRSELFTEQTTLSVLPLLNGNVSLLRVLRLWSIVYLANLLGAAGFAGIAALAVTETSLVSPEVLAEIGEDIVSHPSWVIFVSGVLAGWMMGLLSWLVAAGRDTISQIVIVWLITTGIGLAHLHHSILGTTEVLAGIFAGGETELLDFLRFLTWATLGNATGGAFFVAVIKYGHARPHQHERNAPFKK